MKTFRHLIILVPILLMFSCDNEIPEEDVFDNPLDEEEVTYETPALTFYPKEIETNAGGSFSVEVFVLGVENMSGSYVRFSFDKARLQVVSVNVGSFFTDAEQAPVFISEVDGANGLIDINTSFLGSDSVSVSGTGSLAEIVFTALSAGNSTLSFDGASELVDKDDQTIEIKGFGEGLINAQ